MGDAPASYPPVMTQAANLSRALWDWAVSGFAMASEAEVKRRLAICEACEYFDPGPRRCKHLGCGCYLDAKTRMRSEHCPLPTPKW